MVKNELFFGGIFLFIGIGHGIHVLGIEIGSISNLNTGRLSFESLDAIAASGFLGKSIILLFDGFITAFGLGEIIKIPISDILFNKIKKKSPPSKKKGK